MVLIFLIDEKNILEDKLLIFKSLIEIRDLALLIENY